MKLSGRHMVMQPDCNTTDNLFGGKLLAWLDEAAAMYAMCQVGSKRVVTAHFGALDFTQPTPLGSVVEIYCTVKTRGTTSLTIQSQAIRKGLDGEIDAPIAQCDIVFVHVDEEGKPAPLPTNTNL